MNEHHKEESHQECPFLDMPNALDPKMNYKQQFVYSRISVDHHGKKNTAAMKAPPADVVLKGMK
jgi:hypothetical protein